MADSRSPLTLSREDLYELVWSKPMTELAKDFGLSDVALAKRCRKLGVPVPGRGYWARFAAGQKPHRPKLRKREHEATDHSALTFGPPPEDPPEPAVPEPDEIATLREQLESLPTSENDDLRSANPPVKRTALNLKRPWRKEIQWNRSERKGAIIDIEADEASVDRALLVAEKLIASAATVGWAFKEAPAEPDDRSRYYDRRHRPQLPRFGCLEVEGELLSLRIDERRKRIDHGLTASEKARKRRGEPVYHSRWEYVPTGELRLTVMQPSRRYSSKTWKDSKRYPLETKINRILVDLLDEALKIKVDRETRRLAEIERRKEEELRWAQSRRREANATLIHELESQAGAWLRARYLRSYLRALRRATADQRLQAKRGEETVDFLEWAEHYVDQLDPLSSTPHDEDMKPDRSSYFGPVDRDVNETLNRLLGQQWHKAFKISPSGAASEDD